MGIEHGKKTKKADNRTNQKNLVLNSELLAKLTDIYYDNLICGKYGAKMQLVCKIAPAFVVICKCGARYGFESVHAKIIKEL